MFTNVTEVYQSLNDIAEHLRSSNYDLPEAQWEQIEVKLQDTIGWVERYARDIPDPSKGAVPRSGIPANPDAQKALPTLHSAMEEVRKCSARRAEALIRKASLELRGGGVTAP